MNSSTAAKDAIVIERVINAPVELVWQMWTRPEDYKKWYGPAGFGIPVAEMDLRVGGRRLVCMERPSPGGSMTMWTVGEFTEIVANKRLVYTESMSDENGNIIPPASMGMPEGYPDTTTVTVLLEDLGGSTKMTLTHAGIPGGQEGAAGGWNQAFDKLADYLSAIQRS